MLRPKSGIKSPGSMMPAASAPLYHEFSNPFAAPKLQQGVINPWGEDSPVAEEASSKPLSYKGKQRGSSAAIDMLRASPSDEALRKLLMLLF